MTSVMIGGFTQWAHLRQRERRPGPVSYDLPPSDSPQKSMFSRHTRPLPESGVGPGAYQIPSTVGQCRSVIIAPAPAPPGDAEAAASQRTGRRRRSPPRPLAKQYSLALMPDTPAFSIYPRVSHKIDKPASGLIGPGEYMIPSEFDPAGGGVGKGKCFGKRTAIPNFKGNVPGPGTYTILRFGDDLKKKKEYITSIRKVNTIDPGPGPGCYEDPTTIASRIGKPQKSLNDVPCFGRRYPLQQKISCAPGPSAYGDVSHIMRKPITHTPLLRPLVRETSSKKTAVSAKGEAPGPGTYCIPSEFDRDYRKGVSLGPRLEENGISRMASAVGPGQYDLNNTPSKTQGFRFARSSYDPIAAAEAMARSREAASLPGGPAMYSPMYDKVLPNTYRAVRGFGIGGRFDDRPSSIPLCYDVRPPASSRGTVFSRGDYIRSKNLCQGEAAASEALYDVRNGTIEDNLRSGKGFTFGIRYPARATYQVCKPRDETTNTNCMYPEEEIGRTKMTTM